MQNIQKTVTIPKQTCISLYRQESWAY